MKWVTWENVGVDRIGCAWLILTKPTRFRLPTSNPRLRGSTQAAAKLAF